MRHVLLGCCLAFGLALASQAGPVRAAKDDKPHDKKDDSGHKPHGKVFKSEKHTFDLEQKAEQEKLIALLLSGEVETLHADHGDPRGSFIKQLAEQGIWTIIVFVLLLLVLRAVAWKPILEGLHKREHAIAAAVEEAQKAREETAKLREQMQREIDGAHEKVRGLIEEARRDAQHTRDDMLAQARQEIQTERDRLRREIETARDQALHQIWNEAAQLATLISAKTIARNLTEADHRQLVDEAMAELKEAGSRTRRTGNL
jgi:F-type H+-transporting ATPase subunit b